MNFIESKQTYNKAKKQAKKQFMKIEGKRVEALAKTKPRKFWKHIKQQYKLNPQKTNNIIIEEFYNHFNDLLHKEPPQSEPPTEHMERLDDFLDAPFSEEELINVIKSQNNNKSPGSDKLITEIFKHSIDIVSPFLLSLFNKIYNDGEYPETLGEGLITPIFKGGNKDEPKNYRGITLINVMAKMYSQLLLNRLTKWTELQESIIDNQYGFQKGKSTIDCIFLIHALISMVKILT